MCLVLLIALINYINMSNYSMTSNSDLAILTNVRGIQTPKKGKV